jgi:uncharacterized protein (DUF58 family)
VYRKRYPNRLTSAAMIALLCLFLTLLVSPFKSKSRLEAENVALRRQLIVLRRKVHGRVHLTNGDRLFFVVVNSKDRGAMAAYRGA